MAKSVLELACDTGQWNSGLKKAQGAMDSFVKDAGGMSAALQKDNERMTQFVGMMGKMATTSKTAKGQLNELTKTYTDLTMQYKRLSDAEKKSPFGHALQNSLGQLRGRIQQTRGELDGVNKSLRTTSTEGGGLQNVLGMLTSKFGMSTSALGGWGVALAAATGALKVMKDAFFASEANVDEWGRTVAGAQSVYEGFLTSINTGDVSGFLARIDTIIGAARDAYDAMDKLSTQKAIDSPQIKKYTTEAERLRIMIRTGRYVAPADGRNASLQDGAKLSPKQIESLKTKLKNNQAALRGIYSSEIGTAAAAVDQMYSRQAGELGMSKEEFMRGTADSATFFKNIEGYNKYKKFEEDNTIVVKDDEGGPSTRVRNNKKNPYEAFKAWGVFKDDGATYKKLLEQINDKAALESTYYGMVSSSYRALNKGEGGTGGGGGRSGGRVVNPTGPVVTTPLVFDEFGRGAVSFYDTSNRLSNGSRWGIGSDVWMNAGLNKMTAGMGPIETPNGNRESYWSLERVMGGVSGGLGGLQDISDGLKGLGVETPEALDELIGTINSIMQVIQGVQGVMEAVQMFEEGAQISSTSANTFAVTANTAALGALTGALSLNSATNLFPLHTGGVVHAAGGVYVPGAMAAGKDVVPSILSPGEIVMNAAQTRNLAGKLGDGGKINVEHIISGNELRLLINNQNRMSGSSVRV